MTARTPTWLRSDIVLAIHDGLIAEHGGVPGLRDRGLLESAIEAPKNVFGYGGADIHVLAARYAVGISRNHPFVDGNKRSAFTCAAVFLLRNGWQVTASQAEVVEVMVGLADRRIDDDALSHWLRGHTRRIATQKRTAERRSASRSKPAKRKTRKRPEA